MSLPSVATRNSDAARAKSPPWLRWTLAFEIAVFLLLLLTELRVPWHELSWFVAFVALVPYAIGKLMLRGFGLGDGLDRFESGVAAVAFGLVATGTLAMIGSLIGGTLAIQALLIGLAVLGWGLEFRSRAALVRTTDSLPTAVVVVALAIAHFLLMPGRFTGIDPNGQLQLGGLASDGGYLPFSFVILRDGKLSENVWYAGQPMIFHHFGSMHMQAAYWLLHPGPVDPFFTPRLMHFLVGAPLLIALLAIVTARWTKSTFWTGVIVLTILLPVTAYPNHGRSEGIESLNGFWIQGLHGDINYLFGLVGLVLLVLLMDVHVPVSRGLRPLIGILVLVALAAQVKFNFLLGYGPPAAALVLTDAFRRDRWRGVLVVGSAALTALTVVMGAAWLISGEYAGRGAALVYGLVARETLLPVLQANAPDGLAGLVTAVMAMPNWLQPVAIVGAYCLAYTPLFAVVAMHPFRRPTAIDAFLLSTTAMSGFAVLWIIEGGADRPQAWNFSWHLHYFIPILAALATARLLESCAGRVVRSIAGVAAIVIVTYTAYGVTIGTKSFYLWGITQSIDRDLVALLGDIDRTTAPNAVLLPYRVNLGADDSQLPLFARRTLFLSRNFIFADTHPDAAARQRVSAELDRHWPSVTRVNLDGVNGLSGRPVIVVGRVDHGQPPPLARCRGNYCFWLADTSATP